MADSGMSKLASDFQRSDTVASLARLVELESPSHDKQALDALCTVLAERLRDLEASVEIIDNPLGGNHVLGRFAGAAAELRPALVLGHFDTVWPRGTIERLPFRLDHDGRGVWPGRF